MGCDPSVSFGGIHVRVKLLYSISVYCSRSEQKSPHNCLLHLNAKLMLMKDGGFAMLDMFERTLDLVCIVDKAGWFKKVNPAVIDTLGYSQEELFSQPVSFYIHPDDKELTSIRRSKLLANEPLTNFQNRYISKSGAVIWLEWTSVFVPEEEVVFAIAKNITKRKESEIAIEENYKKYKLLASHFKDNLEKDRKYIAAELHEELAQLATVIKMDMDWLQSKDFLDELSKQRIGHALATSELLVKKTRKLSYSIHPGTIAELGLNEVFRWLCIEFKSVTGIECCFESSVDETELTPEIKIDFFRICQEALLNVMHHAKASLVKIKLEKRKRKIRLSIADNGIGFDHLQEKRSFGLTNMRGRAETIDGELSIESNTNKGTKVSVSVMVKEQ